MLLPLQWLGVRMHRLGKEHMHASFPNVHNIHDATYHLARLGVVGARARSYLHDG